MSRTGNSDKNLIQIKMKGGIKIEKIACDIFEHIPVIYGMPRPLHVGR